MKTTKTILIAALCITFSTATEGSRFWRTPTKKSEEHLIKHASKPIQCNPGENCFSPRRSYVARKYTDEDLNNRPIMDDLDDLSSFMSSDLDTQESSTISTWTQNPRTNTRQPAGEEEVNSGSAGSSASASSPNSAWSKAVGRLRNWISKKDSENKSVPPTSTPVDSDNVETKTPSVQELEAVLAKLAMGPEFGSDIEESTSDAENNDLFDTEPFAFDNDDSFDSDSEAQLLTGPMNRYSNHFIPPTRLMEPSGDAGGVELAENDTTTAAAAAVNATEAVNGTISSSTSSASTPAKKSRALLVHGILLAIVGLLLLSGGLYIWYRRGLKYQSTPTTDTLSSRKISIDNVSVVEAEIGQVIEVKHPYVSQRGDELTVNPGDRIRIRQVFTDRWALGEVVGSGRVGVFPLVTCS